MPNLEQPHLPGFEQPISHELHNVFFALIPDEKTREALALQSAALRQRHETNGRWIKPHRLHMTLQYIDTFEFLPEAVVVNAMGAADHVASKPFDLTLDRVGSFRNTSIPWWIGCSELPEALKNLSNALTTTLRLKGFKKLMTFVPHVTVARDADAMLDSEPIEPIVWRVEEFRLIDSVLGRKSQYITRGTWRLSGAA